jgi:GH15 family glucan-1,4-alpha-glucosidase
MSNSPPAPVKFPPIARHAVIGDRRTGALVAADGTIDWFCAPDFDGPPVFGSVLDPERGGFCRFGPQSAGLGKQRYLPETAALITAWEDSSDGQDLELTDAMAWPRTERPKALDSQRVIIRRLRAPKQAAVSFELRAQRNFKPAPPPSTLANGAVVFAFEAGTLGLWTSFPLELAAQGASALVSIGSGEEHWAVLGWNVDPLQWSPAYAASVFQDAANYWREWSAALTVKDGGSRDPALRRCAITVQLLSHAEYDCAVAALTTSLPERLGGDRNYDYRFAWVRDGSLALALLARLGKPGEVKRYLHWLCSLTSTSASPLQVCYRLDGDPHLAQEDLADVCGYEQSRPVRRGNRAAKQMQLGSLGFLADCARIYIDHGGEWEEEFGALLGRAADFTCEHWQEKDSGVWELPQEADYVVSRVMCWVVLERAVYIVRQTGQKQDTGRWSETAEEIRAQVMEKGWCEEKKSFRQRYGSDAIDASALLTPLMDFLPIDHPRIVGTLAAIERELVVNGLVHRFNPATLSGEQLPIGEFEGAFLPCVFWHAHALAKAGRCDDAEAILAKCEAIAGAPGLFAEEADARHNTFLGNTPLLFSHVEYVRAVMELNKARNREAAQQPDKANS